MTGSLAVLAAAAVLGCSSPPAHPVIAAPRDHAHITIRDAGVQPLCPRRDLGWTVTFHVRGTHINFTARCDRDGGVNVWDAIP